MMNLYNAREMRSQKLLCHSYKHTRSHKPISYNVNIMVMFNEKVGAIFNIARQFFFVE